MPETTTTSLVDRPFWRIALYRPFNTPKSPQPGHQVGFSSLLYASSGRGATATLSGMLMDSFDLLDQPGHGEDTARIVRDRHNLAQVARAQQLGELPAVVHLRDQHDPLRLDERLDLVIRQRPDHPRGHRRHLQALLRRHVDRLDDRPPGRAPAEDADVRVLVAVVVGVRGGLPRKLQLTEALVRHLAMIRRIRARPPVLVVLQAGRDVLAAVLAGDRHRRDAGLGDLVAVVAALDAEAGATVLAVAVWGDRLAVDDLEAREVRRRDALGPHAERRVAQEGDRKLELLG